MSRACKECVCLSGSNGVDGSTSRTALHLSATTGLSLKGFKEQPCMIWGVIVSIYIVIVQGKTVRPRATVIRVEENEVDYLLTNLALWITISFRYAAKKPYIRGLFEEDVMLNELLTCGVCHCDHLFLFLFEYCT